MKTTLQNLIIYFFAKLCFYNCYVSAPFHGVSSTLPSEGRLGTPVFCMIYQYTLMCCTGVSCQGWGVTYTHGHICAVKGSPVVMSCSFIHPLGQKVTKLFWTIHPLPNIEPTDLKKMPDYKGRVEYSPDIDKNCTLTLRHVRLGDAGEYKPRILTDHDEQKWLQKPGIHLTVTGNFRVLFIVKCFY